MGSHFQDGHVNVLLYITFTCILRRELQDVAIPESRVFSINQQMCDTWNYQHN